MKASDNGGVAGPSGIRPVFDRPTSPTSPTMSERNRSTQSPFDDENATESASEYSVSVQDKRRRSSMLDVPEERHINDDGISEMSVSSRVINRKSSLNHRTSDEISVVSSLNDNDDVGSFHEGRAGSQSLITALPEIGGA